MAAAHTSGVKGSLQQAEWNAAIQYATQSVDPIELRVYRGANGSFTLYEDENDNYNYENDTNDEDEPAVPDYYRAYSFVQRHPVRHVLRP